MPRPGDWQREAEELAAVGRRRNILEKKLRSTVVNMIRFDSFNSKDKLSAKERILKAVNDKRRKELGFYPLPTSRSGCGTKRRMRRRGRASISKLLSAHRRDRSE